MKHAIYEVVDDRLVVHLPGEVDDHSSGRIQEETEKYLQGGGIMYMIFDFTNTSFMDSSGIGVLLGRYKRMKQLGGNVAVFGEDNRIKRILNISGIYQIMESLTK